MGLSARKRLSIGPATVHMSASKYGPSSSMSVGTKNRKKGQVNVTYNSKRGLTVSLYGTGIKWKSTKKGMGKTGLTKAQISDRAKSNRLKKENQSKSNKYQKEREARLKLSADVKAKESEIYSFVVDKLSVAGNEIDNFIGKEDEKISKLKDNNLATAELCEEVFSKIIVKIEKICKKEISIKVPERFLTEKGTGYSNTISIHEINLNLNDFFGFELDLCKIDTDRNRVLVDEPKFLGYFYDRYSQGRGS